MWVRIPTVFSSQVNIGTKQEQKIKHLLFVEIDCAFIRQMKHLVAIGHNGERRQWESWLQLNNFGHFFFFCLWPADTIWVWKNTTEKWQRNSYFCVLLFWYLIFLFSIGGSCSDRNSHLDIPAIRIQLMYNKLIKKYRF